ncbi:unannotated protein [freshwater metagenome]|uniref:Unannotated protein n=1 Tax=freshwater metagenome TaxID=449393 RepID=A0A6J6JLF3_9ZZZZ
MEVVVRHNDGRHVLWHTSNPITPGSGNLDGALDGFGATVHGKHHLHTHKLSQLLGKSPKKIVVEGSRREGHRPKLAPGRSR